jgi:hypothetical protein
MGYLDVLVLYWYCVVGKIPRSDSSLVPRVQYLRGQTYIITHTHTQTQTFESEVSDDGARLQGSCKLPHTLLIIGIVVQMCSTKICVPQVIMIHMLYLKLAELCFLHHPAHVGQQQR